MAGCMLNSFDIMSNGFQGARKGTPLVDVEFAKQTTGLRNSGHWVKKLEPLRSEIETTGLRNWNHWIKK